MGKSSKVQHSLQCHGLYAATYRGICQKTSQDVSVFKTRLSAFRDYRGDEFGRTRGGNKIRRDSIKTPPQVSRETFEERLGSVQVQRFQTTYGLDLDKLTLFPRGSDKFWGAIRGKPQIHEVSWGEIEASPRIQARLYRALDRGIVKITDIPQIPVELEPSDKIFYGFDSEDNGLGYPHFYQFATRDAVFISHSFRLLVRYVCNTFLLQKTNHIIWITNLEYDLGNALKDYDVSPKFLEVKWRRGRTTKAVLKFSPEHHEWAEKEDFPGRLVFWDTMNHWPVSVEKQGTILSKVLGYDFFKLKKDFYDLRYAAMDAIVSRSYACFQAKGYEKRDIPLKLTPGATALTWYMKGKTEKGKKFSSQRIFGTHEDWEIEWILKALRGGRTECFSVGEHSGRIGYFDLNSAYPYVMKNRSYPDLRKRFWEQGHETVEKRILQGYQGVVECTVIAEHVEGLAAHIPYLGMIEPKTKRFIFPLGKWRARYSVFEITRAMSMGYDFHFHKGCFYETAREHPFSRYVDAAYALRLEGARTKDPVLKDIGKGLGNNLYGKWGQRAILTEYDFPEKYNAKDIADCVRLGSGVVIEKDKGFSPQTNGIWGVYVTAYCRDLLFEKMQEAVNLGNEVLYSDTDSIFIEGGKWPRTNDTELGALKHEKDLTFFHSPLPKVYVYEYLHNGEVKREYKAKGVPYSERELFFTQGEVEFRKPLKIREAMRRKTLRAEDQQKGIRQGVSAINAWVTVTKELKGKYTKRKVLPGGKTEPIWLNKNLRVGDIDEYFDVE